MVYSVDSLVCRVICCLKYDIKARGGNGISYLGGRIEIRISGETKFVSAENGFLVDDLKIGGFQIIGYFLKQERIILGTVTLFSCIDNSHVH